MRRIITGFIVRDGLTDRDIVAGKEAWWVDIAGPHLAEEIDEQAWVAERCLTKPQGEIRNPTESTCDRANGGMASSWSVADYAEMAQGKAGAIAEGAKSIDHERAAMYFRQAMSAMSAPVVKTTRPDMWSLRGDRKPEPPTSTTPEPKAPPVEAINAAFAVMEAKTDALIAKVDTFIASIQEEIAALPPEVDPEIALQYAFDAKEATVSDLISDSDEVLAGVAVTLAKSDAVLNDMFLLVSRKQAGVTDTEEDDEEDEEEPKPIVNKPVEPPFRPKYDDWGFPIKYPPASTEPTIGSEPSQPKGEPTPEEPVASPSADQLGTAESAHTASQGVGSPSHYESIEPALRAAVIQEKGMKTRIQLTSYLKGKYVQGQADNFIVPDIMAEAVRTALEPISEVARRKHDEAVGAGTALAKGGPRVRIQMTEYASKGGEYLRQDGSKVAYNLTIPDMTVAQVAELIDHQLATHFGVRRGDAGALVRAWDAFMGLETVEGTAGPVEGRSAKDERGALNSVAGDLGNTVQGALLDGHEDIHTATGEFLAVLLPDLLGKTYNKKLHLGLCAVVTGSMLRVIGLWEREADAKVAARRAGGRVVDAQGFLVPQGEVEAAEIAPDEVRA